MEDNRLFKVKDIVGTGILLAIEVVLQVLGMIIPTPVTINLSLIPITIGAILYGPLSGGFLGLACGAIVLATPNTVTLFMATNPVATIVVCLLKTGLAGVAAGYLYKWCQKKNPLAGIISASVAVPLINTLIFAIFCNFFFLEALGLESFWQIFTVLIGINFIFELVSNVIICPSLITILNHTLKKNNVD